MFKIDQHIEHLLLNHDCVIVPGFGGFVIHNLPARFDKGDGIVVPPCTTVGFNPQLILNDTLLIQSFIEAYDMSFPEAQREVEQEVEKLKSIISDNGSFEIHSVGTISINDQGKYEFEPCKAGILSPCFYGLPGIETYDKETFITRKEIEEDSVEDNTLSTTVSVLKKIAVASIAIIIVAAIPFLAQNNQTQQMLSSINISFFKKMIPTTETNTPETVIIKPAKTNRATDIRQSAEITQTSAQTAEQPQSKAKEQLETTGSSYTVVLAARVSQVNAEIYVDQLKKEGLKDIKIIGEGKSRKVIMGSYTTEEEAQESRRAISGDEKFASAWVLKIK